MAKHGEKMKRSILACDNCRASKVKCYNIENVHEKCKRCIAYSYTCVYSPRVSQLRRRSILKLKNRDACSLPNSLPASEAEVMGAPNLIERKKSPTQKSQAFHKSVEYPKVCMPSKCVLLEVSDIFFKNQYQGIFPFIHKPSFQAFLRSNNFKPDTYQDAYREKYERRYNTRPSFLVAPDPLVLLAILALCARLHPTLVVQYGHFDESLDPFLFEPHAFGNQYFSQTQDAKKASNASKYFAWHARNRLKDVFDSPTIQRVQALTMLSSHEWGEMNDARSFSYIGLASRMALVLGMGFSSGVSYKERNGILDFSSDDAYDLKNGTSHEAWTFIISESKRRTLWSVYMMDRCISSGKKRSSAIKIEDIEISLPCPEKNFIFGEPVESLNYKKLIENIEAQYLGPETVTGGKKEFTSNCSSYAFTVAAFEIWAAISKLVGELGSKEENCGPWLELTRYFELSRKIDMLEETLPQHLKYNSSNLNAHIAENTAGFFGYLHSLLFISRIFLNREYFYSSPCSLPEGRWQQSTTELFGAIKQSTHLFKSLSSTDVMVVAPFTGFEIFTNAGTSLYLGTMTKNLLKQHYTMEPSNDSFPVDIDALKRDFKEVASQNMRLLQKWGNVWSLCKLWMDWALQMQTTFDQIGLLMTNDPVNKLPLRLALRDYGQNEIIEGDFYDEEGSEQKKKTKLLKNLLGREGEPKNSSLLNEETVGDSKVGMPDRIMSVDYQVKKFSHLGFSDLMDSNFLDAKSLSSLLPSWYDVTEF